ncbi:MAG: transglycosylase SLT domain-containing protein [bacterium]
MVKYHTLRRKRPSIQLSPPVAAILLLLFLGYVVGSYYLITKKDNELEKYRRNVLTLEQDLEKDKDKLSQKVKEFDVEREGLQRRIAELEERLKVLDVIENFSEGAMAENEQATLAGVVFDESKRFGYDPLMILAIIITESNLRPEARSSVGATGLMQVMPFVGKDLANQVVKKSPDLWDDDHSIEWTGRETLLDPVKNVRLGVLHLSQLIIKFGSVRDGIRAYNHGPTRLKNRIDSGGRLPRLYMQRVLSRYETLKEEYGPRPEILKVAESEGLGDEFIIPSASSEVMVATAILDTTSVLEVPGLVKDPMP